MNQPILLKGLAIAIDATSALQSNAASLKYGDVIIVVQTEGLVYGIDPVTGETALISEKGFLGNPSHVVVDKDGSVLTAERSASRGVVKVNPVDGSQSMLVTDAGLDYPVALAFDGPHDLIIGNSSFATGQKLFRYNAPAGAVTTIATLTGLQNIQDVDVDSGGKIVVLDAGFFNLGGGKIVRFDPSTGQQEVVSSGDRFINPVDLEIDSAGRYVVSNRVGDFSSELVRVDPLTGSQQLLARVADEGFFALKDDNTAYYAAGFGGERNLMKVDLATGQSLAITSVPLGTVGIAVYRPVPEPPFIFMSGTAALAFAFHARRRKLATDICLSN